MDEQIRNIKEYLDLYNNITELCFDKCVDNFFSRELHPEENVCVDKCCKKFINFNQRLVQVFVEIQTGINKNRLAELEASQMTAEPIQVDSNLPKVNKENPTFSDKTSS